MEKTFNEHIKDLTYYFLFNAAIFLIISFGVMAFADNLILLLLEYYGVTAYSFTVMGQINLQITLAFVIGAILTLPIFTYSIYHYCKDFVTIKKWFLFIPASYTLALIGFILGATFFTKRILSTMLSYSYVTTAWSVESIIQVTYTTGLILAITMQLLLVIPILNKIGLLNYSKYSKYRPYIFGMLYIAIMWITPDPNPINAGMLMMPSLVSIEGGFQIGRFTSNPNAENI
jgi:sec-independent protein translocase protein TatC